MSRDVLTRLLCLLMLTQRTASYMPGLVGRRGAVPLRRASKIAAKAAAAPPKYITEDVGNNVTPYIENLVGRGLHRAEAHPLGIIKAKIEEYFQGLDGPAFEIVDDLDPLVQAQACFDDLLIPKDHPGRLPSDTYYVSRPGGREVSASITNSKVLSLEYVDAATDPSGTWTLSAEASLDEVAKPELVLKRGWSF